MRVKKPEFPSWSVATDSFSRVTVTVLSPVAEGEYNIQGVKLQESSLQKVSQSALLKNKTCCP